MRKIVALPVAALGLIGLGGVANASTGAVHPLISEIPCYANYAEVTLRPNPDICFTGLGAEQPNLPGATGLYSGGYTVTFGFAYKNQEHYVTLGQNDPDQGSQPEGGAAFTVNYVDITSVWVGTKS